MSRSSGLLAVILAGLILAAAPVGAIPPVPPKSPAAALPVPEHSHTDLEFRRGLSAYNSGEYAKAMQIWEPLAEQEEPASQAGLGFMYHRGFGVAIDHKKAAYWLRKAAEHGQPEGQMLLGSLYYYGEGVAQSYVQAYAWCDLAQDSGNSDAAACRDGALQSIRSKADVQEAFRLSLDFHHRFGQQH